jgi:hypothetical protein
MSGFPTDRFGRMIEPVTGSVIGFIDNNGNEQFTAPAVGTLAQMLAMSASPGLMFRTTDTCTVNGSISRAGNEWVYDGSQWRPRGPQRVLVDTVLSTGAQQTAEQIIKSYTIKPGLLYLQRFVLEVTLAKTGGTDIMNQLNLRLGPLGTTSDSFLAQTATSIFAAAKRSAGYSCSYECTNTTTIIKHGTGGGFDNNSYTAAAATTVVQTPFVLSGANLQTTAQILTLACSMTAATADSPQIGGVVLTLVP